MDYRSITLANGQSAQSWIDGFSTDSERDIARRAVDRCLANGYPLSILKLRIMMTEIRDQMTALSTSSLNYRDYPRVPKPRPVAHTTVVMPAPRRGNGLGVAGFVFAIMAVHVAVLLPFIGIFIAALPGLLGFLFSLIGVFRSPRGFAVAGLCITAPGLLFILLCYLHTL